MSPSTSNWPSGSWDTFENKQMYIVWILKKKHHQTDFLIWISFQLGFSWFHFQTLSSHYPSCCGIAANFCLQSCCCSLILTEFASITQIGRRGWRAKKKREMNEAQNSSYFSVHVHINSKLWSASSSRRGSSFAGSLFPTKKSVQSSKQRTQHTVSRLYESPRSQSSTTGRARPLENRFAFNEYRESSTDRPRRAAWKSQ